MRIFCVPAFALRFAYFCVIGTWESYFYCLPFYFIFIRFPQLEGYATTTSMNMRNNYFVYFFYSIAI